MVLLAATAFGWRLVLILACCGKASAACRSRSSPMTPPPGSTGGLLNAIMGNSTDRARRADQHADRNPAGTYMADTAATTD